MRIVKILLLLAAAALVGVAGVAFTWYRTPLSLPSTPYDFEVKSGATLSAVARRLADKGVLPHPLALVVLSRWRGVDRSIKAGSYEIDAGITLPGLLAKLTQGDVMQTAVTIVEGATFADMKRTLRETTEITNTALDLPEAELLGRLGIAENSAEGLFFPDTYFFAKGAPDIAVMKRARRLMADRLAAAWNARAPDLPFASPYEALILASIVEKETGRSADRALIASVFVNRLKRGMRLQTDPTVIYGLGDKFDGNLRKRDLEADTPYNTYTRDGLPPTPIALPSQASIDAVLRPMSTQYLYFVSRGDGTSEFSTNLADHNRAVSKYQKNGR